MNKAPAYLLAISALLIVLAAGCNPRAPLIPGGAAGLISSVDGTAPAATTRLPAAQPTGSVAPAVSQLMPICRAAASCEALDAVQIPLDCVKKIPYTNVLVPIGTKFEVVDTSGEFMCLDSGVVVNGKQVITCHGRQLYSFELKLTNAACSDAGLLTGTGQCQPGYGFDPAQQCCQPLSALSGGSTIVRINLGACPVPTP